MSKSDNTYHCSVPRIQSLKIRRFLFMLTISFIQKYTKMGAVVFQAWVHQIVRVVCVNVCRMKEVLFYNTLKSYLVAFYNLDVLWIRKSSVP